MLRNRMNRINRLKMIGALHCNDDGEGGSGGGDNAPTIEDLTAQLADANSSITSMKAKNDELLGEAKKAKTARREVEAKAQSDAEAKAKEAGDHEQLYKSQLERNEQLEGMLSTERAEKAAERVGRKAMEVAAKLADGDNADLLSGFIAQRLKYTDEGLKVTDANGDLTVSSLADLESEFKGNARYAALLKGNQSSGGGATGGNNSGGAAKTMMRADFNTLSQKDPIAASKFMRDGGQLIDN